jgi:F-type H+-transporting ATPase subunit alpha
MDKSSLKTDLDSVFSSIGEILDHYKPGMAPIETGEVVRISSGIVMVSGLPGTGFEELLKFSDTLYGIAFNLDEKEIGVILLGEEEGLEVGDAVYRTHRVMDIPVGDGLIGRVVDPLGLPLDGKAAVTFTKRLPIERQAPAIMDRSPVTVPLQTGIKVIDALIPIGRGQRELILGDRQTGKTAIAIDTILNQKDKNVLCIYCSIGQRASSVAKVIARLREKGAMEYTIVVAAGGSKAPGLSYIAPYAATTMAEYFMEQGKDVLIVYDDLTHHARSYRELSLLLRRPPGREAFPGDIFYIHSRLLERATCLSPERKGGSLTALPIIETEAQNMSAYIPTNLISITDGQIYLSPKLFEQGILPAIDIGKSVSRVGGKAQSLVYRSVTGSLKLAYAQFEELETFARFGTHLDKKTTQTIEHGERIRACFKQPELDPISVSDQIIILLALTNGLFDSIPLDKISDAEKLLRGAGKSIPDEIQKALISGKPITEETKKALLAAVGKIISVFVLKKEAPEKEGSPDNKDNRQKEATSKKGDMPEKSATLENKASPEKNRPEKEISPVSKEAPVKDESQAKEVSPEKNASPEKEILEEKVSPESKKIQGKEDSPESKKFQGKEDSPESKKIQGKENSPESKKIQGKEDSPESKKFQGKEDSPESKKIQGKEDSPENKATPKKEDPEKNKT